MIRAFESCGFEYKVLRAIKYGRDGEPVLLAARREFFGTDTIAVELRPLHVEQETETKVRARLSEELQLSRFLRHRNIGEVLGYAVEGTQPYVVLEHEQGCSLETILDAAVLVKRKVSVGFAATVALAVADALDHAHRCVDEKGRPLHIVHRAVLETIFLKRGLSIAGTAGKARDLISRPRIRKFARMEVQRLELWASIRHRAARNARNDSASLRREGGKRSRWPRSLRRAF